MSVKKTLLNNPPDDPNDDYYLTFCYVCTEQSNDGVNHIRNYGAIVCFSCRAFWRRMHQKPDEINLSCKTGGQCIVNVEERRKCKKCRYDKCIKAGMKPDAVLSEEEKKIRFQKFIEKKRKLLEKQTGKPASNTKRRKVCTVDPFDIDIEDLLQGDCIEITTLDVVENLQVEHPLVTDFTNILQPKISDIASKFKDCAKMNGSDIEWEKMTRGDMCSLMLTLSVEFQQFAKAQSQFLRLNSNDQKILLAKNTPLYIQFWIGLHAIQRFQNFKSGPEIEALTSIFQEGIDVGQYLKKMELLKSIAHLVTQDQKATMAYILLFNVKGLITVNKGDELEDVQFLISLLYHMIVYNQATQMKLPDMIATLKSMAVFYAYYLDTNTNEAMLKGPSYIVTPYTQEEETQINIQFKLIDEAFGSVLLGDFFIQDFMMYSLQLSLPGNCMSDLIAVLYERIRKSYDTHPEFESLENESKLNITNSNSTACLALLIVKSEFCSNGLEQLRFLFGYGEESRLDELYLFDSEDKILKIPMIDKTMLSATQAKKFQKLLTKCNKEFVSDETLFKLILLLIMFEPKKLWQTEPCVMRLYQKYKTLIKRRLEWMAFTSGNSNGQYSDQNTDQMVGVIKKLAKLLKSLGI